MIRFGKKYTRFPSEKQAEVKANIQELAKNISYEELQPLFGTAVKKAGTRIVTMISLGVLLDSGLKTNSEIQDFVNKALEDRNELLVEEANAVFLKLKG